MEWVMHTGKHRHRYFKITIWNEWRMKLQNEAQTEQIYMKLNKTMEVKLTSFILCEGFIVPLG